MKLFKIVSAFAVGCLATSIVSQIEIRVRAQDDDGGPVRVCVASDGVMRVVPNTDGCPQGQRTLMLKRADSKVDLDTPKKKKSNDDDSSSIDKTILEDLNRRLISLESLGCAAIGKSKVVAPFVVTGRSEKTVFMVNEAGATLYNRNGDSVARMVPGEEGGFFSALGKGKSAVLGFTDEVHGFAIREADKLRVEAGRDEKTQSYRLRFTSEAGKGVAVIGQTASGGRAFVGDAQGVARAGMTFINNKGVVTIFNAGGQSVAELTESDGKNGRFAIFNASGENMVVAGVTEGGYGVVRAGPESFKPGYGLLGLPGSFIMGKK